MNVRAEGEPLMIEDTVHMTHFVHEFYLSNMQAMKEAYEMEMAAQIEEAKVRNIVGRRIGNNTWLQKRAPPKPAENEQEKLQKMREGGIAEAETAQDAKERAYAEAEVGIRFGIIMLSLLLEKFR